MKMDHDPYVYPSTDVLINKFGEKDIDKLNGYEADFTAVRIKELIDNDLNYNFDFKDLCGLHFHIFQDIYEWAGQPRVMNIEKSELALMGHSIEYADFKKIESTSDSVLLKMRTIQWDKLSLDDKAKEFSDCMADLWKVHPFREGNTRSVVTFCSKFAESRGIALDIQLFQKHSAYLRTALVAYNAIWEDLGDKRQPQHLLKIVKDSMQNGLEKTNNKSSVIARLKANKKKIDSTSTNSKKPRQKKEFENNKER